MNNQPENMDGLDWVQMVYIAALFLIIGLQEWLADSGARFLISFFKSL